MEHSTITPPLTIEYDSPCTVPPVTQHIVNLDGMDIYMTTWKSSNDQASYNFNAQIKLTNRDTINANLLEIRDRFQYDFEDRILNLTRTEIINGILVIEGQKQKPSVPDSIRVCHNCGEHYAVDFSHCPHCHQIARTMVLWYREYWIVSYGNGPGYFVDLGTMRSKKLLTLEEAKQLIDEIANF